MEITSICGDKYKYFSEKKIIYMPIEIDNLADELKIDDYTLLKRKEFHVSLVCIQRIVDKYNVSILDFDAKIIDDFCEFTKTNKVEVTGIKDEFKFITKEDRKTVVVMCAVSNLDKFFVMINKKYSLQIEIPPTHITLYTLDGNLGVALISAEDIKNFTKPIPNPIGRLL